ncbi:MAG: PAS domain S-box protein [Candidatus Latescibacteria bacterium]|nr:PAS domain S-box protein [Candidatus Latescibacterota bacterium]
MAQANIWGELSPTALYFAALVVAACLMAVMLTVLIHKYQRDIERRKETEQQLREREQQYRDLLASAERQTQELALLDQIRTALARELALPDLMRTVVKAIADTFGYALVSIYLLEDDDLVMQHQVGYEGSIENMPTDSEVMARVVRTGEPVLLEDVSRDPTVHRSADDVESEVCIPLFDQGRGVGVLNVESKKGVVLSEADLLLMMALSDHINIAIERARLYTEARENERSYRSVVENVKEVIFKTDIDGRITFLNPAWQDVTGYSVRDAMGTNILLYVHPDDRRQHMEFFNPILTRQRPSDRDEFRYVNQSGDLRWIEVNARVSEDTDGAPLGIFGTLNDITERKQIDEERFRLSKLEAISPLAGGIAHDFNNLLTGILGHISFAHLLITPEADDRLAPRLTMAERATLEAQKLTQQLLTFSKGGEPVTQIASIREILYEAATFVSRGSNVRCDFEVPEELWPGDVDSGQISQVIQNLILNAQQAMPEGGVIRIQAENLSKIVDPALQLQPGQYVRITVSDEGIGIPEQQQQKIFDPYFTTKPTGTGLGLATSHSIINNHHGAIYLESEVGEGSTFTIYLPASPDSRIEKHEEEEIYFNGTGKILVMEDEAIVRDLVADILTHCGYAVTLTEDGAEAVSTYSREHAAGRPFAAVLMDLTVPGGMGGREALQHILMKDPQARVIASSGYSNDPVMANFHEYGFAGRVPKPYRTTQLSKVLHEVLAIGHETSSQTQ